MTAPNAASDRRAFVKVQLRRITSLWPLNPSEEALDEYVRVLRGFSDDEIARGVDQVIDTHQLPSAPKPADIRLATAQVAKILRNIPLTEQQRVEQGLQERELRAEALETERLEHWLEQQPDEIRAEFDRELAALVEPWPEHKRDTARRIFRAAALATVYARQGKPLFLTPENAA